MNPEQWLSLKWNGGSTMSDRWLNQSKIIHNSDSICDLSTKYGCSVCPLHKTYEVELFRYLPMIFPPIYAKIKPFCSFSISISKSLL